MWPFKKRSSTNRKAEYLSKKSGFFSSIEGRVFSGWDTSSNSIDYYLKEDLTKLRARSRALVRKNTYGKRFIDVMKSNIVGPNGIQDNAQRMMANGKPDSRSNTAVEKAFKDWSQNHCDFYGKSCFADLQNVAIACAAQDGEFIFEKVQGGKYDYQLKAIDPELLDTQKNEKTKRGEIRLGVEYDAMGRIARYWFRERGFNGDYQTANTYSIKADRIIHCFVPLYPDQSRGLPWTHAALEATKHLEKYQEGAIVNARASANTFNVVKSQPGDAYTGDEDAGNGDSYANVEAGSILDIGNKEIVNIDPNYPHQMFDAFVKSNLRSIASGLGISYHSLSNDLEGVNYSSIRAGVLEDRELFKTYQNWFVRCFVRTVFEDWVMYAHPKKAIVLPGGRPVDGPPFSYQAATYQPRRWSWVDPQKDGTANQLSINERLKSRTQIMREQGDDPDAVWAEIAKENELMASLGIQPSTPEPT